LTSSQEEIKGTIIGREIHYYPRIGVAAVFHQDHPAKGDRIHIRGPHDEVHQAVTSMEIEHIPIKDAGKGQKIGIKVTERVHEGDVVFREG
jgi:hypothetical protein